MQVSENLMKSANLWTVQMHDIAARTEQETVAMGIITFFTLVLLPCTFVAVSYGLLLLVSAACTSLSLMPWQTFFSSGILQFDTADAENGRMGNWGVHKSALWLFLGLSLPLMVVTLATWAIYRFAAGRRERLKSTEADLPPSEKQGRDTSQPSSPTAQ